MRINMCSQCHQSWRYRCMIRMVRRHPHTILFAKFQFAFQQRCDMWAFGRFERKKSSDTVCEWFCRTIIAIRNDIIPILLYVNVRVVCHAMPWRNHNVACMCVCVLFVIGEWLHTLVLEWIFIITLYIEIGNFQRMHMHTHTHAHAMDSTDR